MAFHCTKIQPMAKEHEQLVTGSRIQIMCFQRDILRHLAAIAKIGGGGGQYRWPCQFPPEHCAISVALRFHMPTCQSSQQIFQPRALFSATRRRFGAAVSNSPSRDGLRQAGTQPQCSGLDFGLKLGQLPLALGWGAHNSLLNEGWARRNENPQPPILAHQRRAHGLFVIADNGRYTRSRSEKGDK